MENDPPRLATRVEMGFVLAGGSSSRMGKAKAFLEIGGKSLLERAISCLSPSAAQIAVIGLEAHQFPTASCHPDLTPGRGPLSGIRTGLTLSNADPVLFCPCDCPLLPESTFPLLLRQLGEAQVAVPVDSSGRVHPLIGVYRRACLEPLESLLDASLFAVMGLIDTLAEEVQRVDFSRHGIMDGALLNVNTPESLEKARSQILGLSR